jgi:hypothetical protein
MKPGSLIQTLDGLCQRELPALIRDPSTPWQTLDVTYEDPHVERVWVQLGEYRVNLHCIHPCPVALRHPHPWPSAIRVLSGQYKMGIGKLGQDGDAEIATIILTADSSYEMLHPHGWHYVQPLLRPSLSVMLTGKPWLTTAIKHPGKGLNQPLTGIRKAEILAEFARFLTLTDV